MSSQPRNRPFNSRGPKFPIPTDGLWAWRIPAPKMSRVKAQQQLEKVRTVAMWLDSIPGSPFPIGLDSIVGFIPQIGDLAGTLASLYQLYLSLWFAIPIWMIAQILINIAIDFFIGIVPGIGDILDIIFMSNIYNLNLLEDWLILEGVLGQGDVPEGDWGRQRRGGRRY